jgi:hypothetical protein
VDSFFDIEYQIDFEGAPGSVLEYKAGRTQGNIRMVLTPEPATLALLLLGGLALLRRKRSA